MSANLADVIAAALTYGTDEHITVNGWVAGLTEAITRISHGDVAGPTGLEGVAMAITAHAEAVSSSADVIASALLEVADAYNRQTAYMEAADAAGQ